MCPNPTVSFSHGPQDCKMHNFFYQHWRGNHIHIYLYVAVFSLSSNELFVPGPAFSAHPSPSQQFSSHRFAVPKQFWSSSKSLKRWTNPWIVYKWCVWSIVLIGTLKVLMVIGLSTLGDPLFFLFRWVWKAGFGMVGCATAQAQTRRYLLG